MMSQSGGYRGPLETGPARVSGEFPRATALTCGSTASSSPTTR